MEKQITMVYLDRGKVKTYVITDPATIKAINNQEN